MGLEFWSSPRRILLAIVLIGLILRVAMVALIAPTPPVSAEAIYSFGAKSREGAVPMQVDFDRPPGTVYFYRLLMSAFGDDRVVLRLGNAVLGTLFLLIVYAWSRKYVSEPVALVAAFLAAIHPELISFSTSLWSETLYLVLVYSAFLIFLRPERPMSLPRSLLYGVLFALACLTRDIALFLLPFLVVDLLSAWRTATRRSVLSALVLLVGFTLPILPRAIEMTQRSGSLVLVSCLNEARLYVGNVEIPEVRTSKDPQALQQGVGIRMYTKLSPDPQERRRLARQTVWNSVREKLPLWPFQKLGQELPAFFTPNSYPAMRLFGDPREKTWAGQWAYRFSVEALDRRWIRNAIGAIVVACTIATILASAAALGLLRLSSSFAPLAIYSLTHILPTLVTSANSRFRLPILPILLLGVAALLVHGRGLWRQATPRRRLLSVATLIAAGILLAQGIASVYPPRYG